MDDEQSIQTLLSYPLRKEGYDVVQATDGRAALDRFDEGTFDLVVLDLMLPGVDGLEICRRLRSRPPYTPIMMLTAKVTELDRVLGLELGADDYLTKPFSIRELVARVKALFRRIEQLETASEPQTEEVLRFGTLEADLAKREVRADGEPVGLTSKEFDLLLHFLRNPGRVYTRMQLLDAVWGYGYEGYEHNVNCHINRLRAKIENDPASPRFILTVRGVGYRLGDSRPAPE